MAVTAPKCSFCGHKHWSSEPHRGSDAPTLKKKVATIIKKRVSSASNVATIRKVTIRQLNNNISKHFSNLPFEVTKNGKVIARVEGVK